MKQLIIDGLIAGLSGAAAVLITDAVVTRVPTINRSRVAMGASRVTLGALGAYGAERLDAPNAAVCGVIAGPIMMTAIEAAMHAIPATRPQLSAATMREFAAQAATTGR
jgi:hypothetical protein